MPIRTLSWWQEVLCFTQHISLSLQNNLPSVPAFLCGEGFRLLSCEPTTAGCVTIVALHFEFITVNSCISVRLWAGFTNHKTGRIPLCIQKQEHQVLPWSNLCQNELAKTKYTVKVQCLDRQMCRFTHAVFAHAVAGHFLYVCHSSLSV